MSAKRKVAEPPRPPALKAFPKAEWDGEFWRDGEFWYDERTADKAAAFFPNHLVFTEGEWAGRPFVLEEWEEHDIVRPLFGWKRADGTRRFRRCFVWIARKNGKTELAAGIALLILVGDAEMGGQVFSIASEEAQAKIVFTKAKSSGRIDLIAATVNALGIASQGDPAPATSPWDDPNFSLMGEPAS